MAGHHLGRLALWDDLPARDHHGARLHPPALPDRAAAQSAMAVGRLVHRARDRPLDPPRGLRARAVGRQRDAPESRGHRGRRTDERRPERDHLDRVRDRSPPGGRLGRAPLPAWHCHRAGAAQVVRCRGRTDRRLLRPRDPADRTALGHRMGRWHRDHLAHPGRHRHRHPALPAVRDRPDHQPDPELRGCDGDPGARLRDSRSRASGGPRADDRREHDRCGGLHADRGGLVPATPPPGPASGRSTLRQGALRRADDRRQLRSPTARRGRPRHPPGLAPRPPRATWSGPSTRPSGCAVRPDDGPFVERESREDDATIDAGGSRWP